MTLRVAVIEDSPMFRSALEQLLREAPGIEPVGSFAAAEPALRRLTGAGAGEEPPACDVVLMDLELPKMNGIEATRRLKELRPEVKVIALTVFEEPGTILEAICAGADGYMLKKARARELLASLRSVMEGGAALTPEIARSVLSMVRGARPLPQSGPPPGRLRLTEREQEVLRALVEGKSYKQVGAALGISLGTVRTHVTAIYRKLQVHSVAEAVTRAVRDRIV